MKIETNISLAPYTSYGTGGTADKAIFSAYTNSLVRRLDVIAAEEPIWFLGYGTNTLISDHGLPGTTVLMRGGHTQISDFNSNSPLLISDAGVWWDDLVMAAIENDLWGLELMSGIPGSVGAAIVGNIAAYGQAVADTLEWIEVVDLKQQPHKLRRIPAQNLKLEYRESNLKLHENDHIMVLRAAFRLNRKQVKQLKYESALNVARELEMGIDDLEELRETILEARRRAGSLYEDDEESAKTAGSVFKNPLLPLKQAEQVLKHEERAVTKAQILAQNRIHGGNSTRVSSAHVMLAAGFERGQSWGPVRLHPDHILKIENTGDATSQQIYEVIKEIQDTVRGKLSIVLEPEIRFLGEF